jgi:hypothetical protein
MSTGTCGPRRWRRAWPQRVGLLAAVAGLALLTVACSSNSSSTGTGGSPQAASVTPSASHQAVAFAQCMRAHGVPNYPDPGSVSGPINPSQLGVSDATYQSAKTTCTRLDPPPQQSAGLTTAQEQHVLGELLNFSRCMRSHGVPNFPDPNSASTIWGSGGGSLFTTPSSINTSSTQFSSAQNACKSLMPSSGEIRVNKGS